MDTSVLIVGGGLNGLTAALLLAQQGVRCLLVGHGSCLCVKFLNSPARYAMVGRVSRVHVIARRLRRRHRSSHR